MSYLIDTCCISELVKQKPEPNVITWFGQQDERSLYLSVITFGELKKGVVKLPDSKKKKDLNLWIKKDLNERFKGRVLDITMEVSDKWGEILAKAEKKGQALPAIDSLIAATALVHGFSVVTRNTRDMRNSGVELINPWIAESNT